MGKAIMASLSRVLELIVEIVYVSCPKCKRKKQKWFKKCPYCHYGFIDLTADWPKAPTIPEIND